VNVTIKNLPAEVADGLRRSAAEKGQSLNAHVISLLTQANAAALRQRDMKEALRELDAIVAALPPIAGGTEAVLEEREERELRHG
jgi:plasmid stability protein